MKTTFAPTSCGTYPVQLWLILVCLLGYSAGERAIRAASGPTAVLTSYNDNQRTGANLTETLLTTNNVNTNQFGLLYTRPVDDQIYAQPLIMTNVTIPGKGVKNLLLVATVNDSVYAFDADDATVTAPYWAVSFINPPNVVAPANTDLSAIGACGGNYRDFSGKMGIVGAPVIDPVAGTIYVVARTKESGARFFQIRKVLVTIACLPLENLYRLYFGRSNSRAATQQVAFYHTIVQKCKCCTYCS